MTLPRYIIGSEDPVTCPKCGARCEHPDAVSAAAACLGCGYIFLYEIEAEPDLGNDEFMCEDCGKIEDIEESVRVADRLVCEDCAQTENSIAEKRGLKHD